MRSPFLVALIALVAACEPGETPRSEALDTPTAEFEFPAIEVDTTRPVPVDRCVGADASGDSDSDGICDDSDECTGDDATGDTDEDGVCDDEDLCEGDDSLGDADENGICDVPA